MMPIFALVDCNAFFASCEQVFSPKLEGRPIVILSNNDGCIIARSSAAKRLGIPMGAPLYSCRSLCQKHGVHIFSSNFQLYGDMSSRVMAILQQYVKDVEIYSIDEAFLCLDGIDPEGVLEYIAGIRAKIKTWTGLWVSIGVGPSKTLAKVATAVAKKSAAVGVFSLMDAQVQDKVLAELDIEEIWGISFRWGRRFRECGIHTALQLRDADSQMIRRHFSVVGQRILKELNGIPCLPVGSNTTSRKSIISSRSFGKRLNNIDKIGEAVSSYAASASVKLRKQRKRARSIYVYIKTNRFRSDEQQYNKGIFMRFPDPTSDTRAIIKAALSCLKSIYQPGFYYHKAGVMLLDLVGEILPQKELFLAVDHTKGDKLMGALDLINARMGKNTVFLAAQGVNRDWQMRCDKMSPRYTTRWDELPNVYCV